MRFGCATRTYVRHPQEVRRDKRCTKITSKCVKLFRPFWVTILLPQFPGPVLLSHHRFFPTYHPSTGPFFVAGSGQKEPWAYAEERRFLSVKLRLQDRAQDRRGFLRIARARA